MAHACRLAGLEVKINPESPCIFTRGLKGVYLPVRHGEGNFIPRDGAVQRELRKRGSIIEPIIPAGLERNYPKRE